MSYVSTLFNIYMMGIVEELERAQLGVKLETVGVGLLCMRTARG